LILNTGISYLTKPVFIITYKMGNNNLRVIDSITELHRRFSLPAPEHPLVSIIDLKDMRITEGQADSKVAFNFYSVWLEDNVQEKIRYGQSYFDFDEGKMIFIAPKQVLSAADHQQTNKGYGLVFHPIIDQQLHSRLYDLFFLIHYAKISMLE